MTVKEIAWLAGYLEGEGCFGKVKDKYPSIRVSATDEDDIEKVARLWMLNRQPYGGAGHYGGKPV